MDYLLLISGAGRNVGKTTLCCQLIEQLKGTCEISAVKISSHFHELAPMQKIVLEEPDLVISVEEDRNSSKDSSRYLRAGANRSIYVQSTDETIEIVYRWMKENLSGFVICESASLGRKIIPDKAIFVSSSIIEKTPRWSFHFKTTELINGHFVPEIHITEK